MRIFEKKLKYKREYIHVSVYFLGIKIFTYKSKRNLNPIDYARNIGVSIGKNVRIICHPELTDFPDFWS